jgi:hypothetical protein
MADGVTMRRLLLAWSRTAEIASGRRRMLHPNLDLPPVTIDRPVRKPRKRKNYGEVTKALSPEQLTLL